MKSLVALPYSTGVYLAVNAIPDIALVMDGPDCLFHRADLIQGNHDLGATLLDVTGRHRVVNTFADVNTVVLDRRSVLCEAIETLVVREGCHAVLVGALPVAYLTGVPYEAVVADFAGRSRPVLLLPRRSLRADWRGGYADALAALAEGIALSPRPAPSERAARPRVAVVGPLLHRTEGDGTGDVAELERLIAALDLDCVSVWPSGRPLAHLARAGEADFILSLPYARDAAATLARRTGARLIEVPLPLGLSATAAFLEAVAAATARGAEAAAFIAEEERRVAQRIEWVVPNAITGRRFALIAEPELAGPLTAALAELGAEVPFVAHLATFDAPPAAEAVGPGVAREVLPETDLVRVEERLAVLDAARPFALALGNAFLLPVFERLGIPYLEHGFPAHTEHALTPRPTLGYEGLLCLLERIYNRIQLWAVRRA